jgi:cellulose synthase/poly-beta-1,6-N-acetylglucosamine synthase-like glycosyltransferase
LTYSFLAFYFLALFILIYFQNRKEILSFPKAKKEYSLSVVVPCYNEEKTIGDTIESLIKSDYHGLKKIFVVDDCSRDNSFKIIKKYAEKYSGKVFALQTPKNSGKASGSKNYGAKFVKTELIGFTDADSYPQEDSISKMIGFFDNPKVAAVTSMVLAKKMNKFIEKLQSIEYRIIAFSRKLLGFVDAIYVTPGPLAIYRKKIFDEVGGFDETNLTEDIEITWNFVSRGYKVEMSTQSRVYTVVPDKFRNWFRQRIRWNMGGIQTILKYKKSFFNCGMLGFFILPFFVLSWFLGISGIFILGYRLFRTIAVRYLSISYSVYAQTAILNLQEINLIPSMLIFFGVILFVFSFMFTILSLFHSKSETKEFKKYKLLGIMVYMFVYLLAYPFLLMVSIYKIIRKRHTW